MNKRDQDIVKDTQHSIMVKENEIRNTRNLIDKNEKHLFELRMKVENLA